MNMLPSVINCHNTAASYAVPTVRLLWAIFASPFFPSSHQYHKSNIKTYFPCCDLFSDLDFLIETFPLDGWWFLFVGQLMHTIHPQGKEENNRTSRDEGESMTWLFNITSCSKKVSLFFVFRPPPRLLHPHPHTPLQSVPSRLSPVSVLRGVRHDTLSLQRHQSPPSGWALIGSTH